MRAPIFYKNSLNMVKIPADMIIVTGIVVNHAVTMALAVLHFTPFIRFAAPTPIIEEDITWVVLTGIPKYVAA